MVSQLKAAPAPTADADANDAPCRVVLSPPAQLILAFLNEISAATHAKISILGRLPRPSLASAPSRAARRRLNEEHKGQMDRLQRRRVEAIQGVPLEVAADVEGLMRGLMGRVEGAHGSVCKWWKSLQEDFDGPGRRRYSGRRYTPPGSVQDIVDALHENPEPRQELEARLWGIAVAISRPNAPAVQEEAKELMRPTLAELAELANKLRDATLCLPGPRPGEAGQASVPAGNGSCGDELPEPRETAPEKVQQASRQRNPPGGARAKIIAGLVAHHQYANAALHQTPIVVNHFAKEPARVSPGSVSGFLKRECGGYIGYCGRCRDEKGLRQWLKKLNGDFASYTRYKDDQFDDEDSRPGGRDDE